MKKNFFVRFIINCLKNFIFNFAGICLRSVLLEFLLQWPWTHSHCRWPKSGAGLRGHRWPSTGRSLASRCEASTFTGQFADLFQSGSRRPGCHSAVADDPRIHCARSDRILVPCLDRPKSGGPEISSHLFEICKINRKWLFNHYCPVVGVIFDRLLRDRCGDYLSKRKTEKTGAEKKSTKIKVIFLEWEYTLPLSHCSIKYLKKNSAKFKKFCKTPYKNF